MDAPPLIGKSSAHLDTLINLGVLNDFKTLADFRRLDLSLLAKINQNRFYDTPDDGVDYHGMAVALALAKIAYLADEVPVGACIFHQNQLIGAGFNCPISANDASAHAEVMAIRDACVRVGSYRLGGSVMYVSLEPCTMCFGALIHARIDKVVLGTNEPKAGVINSHAHLDKMVFYNHKMQVTSGILAGQSQRLLQNFFKQRRAQRLNQKD